MRHINVIHTDLEGREWNLGSLDSEELSLLNAIRKHDGACRKEDAKPAQRWCDFDNFWVPKVLAFYTARGLTRKQIIQTPVYQIAQDLSGRIAVDLGLALPPVDVMEEPVKTKSA